MKTRCFKYAVSQIAILIVLASPSQAQVDSTLIRIRALSIDSINTSIPTYFSEGAELRAMQLSELLKEADNYLREALGIQANFSLAVLAEEDWNQVWPFPYGIPYVSLHAPWVIVLPANPEKSVLYPGFSYILEHNDVLSMIDNIGFHEVGHVYISEYLYPDEINAGPTLRWFDEFLAQYLAYSYLT